MDCHLRSVKGCAIGPADGVFMRGARHEGASVGLAQRSRVGDVRRLLGPFGTAKCVRVAGAQRGVDQVRSRVDQLLALSRDRDTSVRPCSRDWESEFLQIRFHHHPDRVLRSARVARVEASRPASTAKATRPVPRRGDSPRARPGGRNPAVALHATVWACFSSPSSSRRLSCTCSLVLLNTANSRPSSPGRQPSPPAIRDVVAVLVPVHAELAEQGSCRWGR